jgi:translation initiation factor 3 subunit B
VELAKQNISGLKQFLWRPRPKTLLTVVEQKKIKKKLKEYSKEFDEEDALLSNKASTEVQEKRRAQLIAYKEFITKFDQLKAKEADVRVGLFGFDPYNMSNEGEELLIEEIINIIEEIVE